MDRFQSVVANSALPCMIIGRPDASEFALIEFENDSPETISETPNLSGFVFIGVVGLRDDGPMVAFQVIPSDEAMVKLAEAYANHCVAYRDAALAKLAQSSDWLNALHTLPDTRPEYPN